MLLNHGVLERAWLLLPPVHFTNGKRDLSNLWRWEVLHFQDRKRPAYFPDSRAAPERPALRHFRYVRSESESGRQRHQQRTRINFKSTWVSRQPVNNELRGGATAEQPQDACWRSLPLESAPRVKLIIRRRRQAKARSKKGPHDPALQPDHAALH